MIHQSCGLQIFSHLFTAVETIHAVELLHVLANLGFDGIEVDMCVGSEYVVGNEVVLLPEHVVVHVVCRRYFQAARTEADLHISVFDDRYLATYNRYAHVLSAQPLVLFLFGVDAYRNIAEDSFGTSGSHNRILAGLFNHFVFEVVELRVLVVIDHFLVAEGSLTFGVPVHHTQASVDESFAIEVAEHGDHSA